MSNTEKKYFLSWANIRWLITELVKTYSNQPSFFASKRIERSLLFISALGLTIQYVRCHKFTMTSGDLMLIVGGLFIYAGYNTNVMRKEKKDEIKDTN